MKSESDSRRSAGDCISLVELVAYAEGRLPPGLANHARVEEWLRTHPEDAARVRAYMRQDRCIRGAWGDVTKEMVPARLQPARISRHRMRPSGQWLRPTAMAAALALAAVTGFLAGRADLSSSAPEADLGQRIASELDAELLPTGPLHLVAEHLVAGHAGAAEHRGTPAMARAHGAPDLSDLGMRFMGGDASAAHGVEEFQYAGPYGEPVHLFRSADTEGEPGAVRTLEGDGVNLVYWRQGGSVLALAGPVDLDHLQALALRSMARLAGETPLPGSAPRPAADGRIPGIAMEPLHTPELRIAPMPEMLPMPATAPDGV